MDATHAFHFSTYHKQRDRYGICQRLSCCCVKPRDILAGWHVGVAEGDDLSSLTTLIKLPFPLAHLLSCSNALTASSLISSPHHPPNHLLLLSPFQSLPGRKRVSTFLFSYQSGSQCSSLLMITSVMVVTQYLLKLHWASKIEKIALPTAISN